MRGLTSRQLIQSWGDCTAVALACSAWRCNALVMPVHEAIARRGDGREMSALMQSACLANLYCIVINSGRVWLSTYSTANLKRTTV